MSNNNAFIVSTLPQEHSNRHWIRPNRSYAYGAAGVRGNATTDRDEHGKSEMIFIAYRMGYLAGLLARSKNTVVGVMISGGHNNKDDNGIKIIGSDGSIIAPEWQRHAFYLLNADDRQFLLKVYEFERDMYRPKPPMAITKVYCAHDSRTSSYRLADVVKLGTTLGREESRFELLRMLPTPVLHFVLFTRDPDRQKAARMGDANGDVISRYYDHFSSVFLTLHRLLAARPIQASHINYQSKLYLDCANGVGSIGMRRLLGRINSDLDIDYRNENDGAAVNYECGADFVMNFPYKAPSNFKSLDVIDKCAALSGDGARLVYFYKKDPKGTIEFLDGDKIALLIARFFAKHLQLLCLSDIFNVTLVQTNFSDRGTWRYTNANSGISRRLENDGIRYSSQWELKERHCIIYFEPCGLGTASFSELFFTNLEDRSEDLTKPNREAAKRLLNICRLINTSGYDGMTNLLVVESILRYNNWTVEDWAKAYNFDPSIQHKIDQKIPRTIIFEKRFLINTAVNELLRRRDKNEYMKVRASSTENELVRVCIDSPTPEDLAETIEKAIVGVITSCRTTDETRFFIYDMIEPVEESNQEKEQGGNQETMERA